MQRTASHLLKSFVSTNARDIRFLRVWQRRQRYQAHFSTAKRKGRRRSTPQAAASPLLAPQTVFNVVTLAVMPLYGLMVAFPRKQLTRTIVASPLLYTAGSLLYTAALASWGLHGQLWNAFAQALTKQQVTAFAALFQSPEVTALSWIHLLLLDLCVARHVYLDGLKKQVFSAHSIIFCFMFGPTGLLCHMCTKWLTAQRRLSINT